MSDVTFNDLDLSLIIASTIGVIVLFLYDVVHLILYVFNVEDEAKEARQKVPENSVNIIEIS